MLTIDRFEMTSQTMEHNLKNAGKLHTLEVLIADNGSKDRRIVNHFACHPQVTYHRVNSKNEGCGKAFNQLFLRSKGEYICLLGNDIEMPPGWCDEMVKYAHGVPNSGIIGMDWGHSGLPPMDLKFGIHGHWLTKQLNRVFGAWVLRREVIDKVGFFPDHYDVYGLEDSSFNERVNRSGFNSVYVPNTHFKSSHLAPDVGENSEYRKMKDASMGRNLAFLHDDVYQWDRGKPLYEPLPQMRDPL
jgi:GT2 family glycosyltransferase